jgi:methionyl-tRNA formyltransferase
MTGEIDAGPVYLKEELSLEGPAQEIYLRASELAARMIQRILLEKPTPRPQEGDIVEFRRRTPEESAIPPLHSLGALYDYVRMLDAEGYPRAYIELEGLRYEFSNARLSGKQLRADVRVTTTEEIDR